jgi:hypothetical protein
MSVSYLAATGFELGSGRLLPTVAIVVGLAGVIAGWLALVRPGRPVPAVVALAAGLVSVVVGGLHMANSAGGFGTGNGLAGAMVAVVLGLGGMVTGGLARVRSRRATG